MDRLTRHEYFKQIAELTARRSTCLRGQVGALIVRDHRIISTGYNGPLPNEPHCSGEVCNLEVPCQRSIHAEQNAILYAAREGISLVGTTLYCTTLPCPSCAASIVQAGIARVYHSKSFRTLAGANILKDHGVIVEQL